MRYLILFLILALAPLLAVAQRTAVDADPHGMYMEGQAYFDAGLYGQAFEAFEEVLNLDLPINEPEFALLRTRAQLNRAKSAVRHGLPEAELMVLDFIQSTRPDPIATEATLEIAHYYFDKNNYEKALTYYALIDHRELTQAQSSEVTFRQGYSHFVKQEFAEAESAFARIKEQRDAFFYPANYYYGMCRFFEADYEAALLSFERVLPSQKYEAYVPYYITQIYFAQGRYDDVVTYGERVLNGPRVNNLQDIHHLVGQAHFEQGNYAAALPHLEYYESRSGKMRAEDFFQLAFVQYDQGQCDKAIDNFLNIAQEATILGQRANFYLADCYLKQGDTRSARNAFWSVSKMHFDPALREEARFNYGKLSAELDYDFEAIQALDPITSASPYYAEAQRILRDVFENTRDYASALETLRSIPSLSPTLKEAYQRLSLLRGMQLLIDGDPAAADRSLAEVQTYPLNPAYSAQGLFWRAEIAHADGRFQESINFYSQYFTLARNRQDLPVESSEPVANYNQGYNYLKLKNYATALGHFQEAIAGIRQNRADFSDPYYMHQVLPDAQLRAGDCLYKRNRYQEAVRFYQASIDLQKYGYVYGKFQKAMIQGLLGNPLDKILQLEDLVRQHPSSQFADDALFNAAVTYQQMGSADKALVALNRLVKTYPSSDLVNASHLRLGLISYNNGDLNASIAYYKKVLGSNPDASEAQEALSALEEIYVQDLARPTEYFAYVESLPGYQVSEIKKDSVSFRAAEIGYENGNYQRAINLFNAYLQQYPNGINVIAAHYLRGESHAILKQYDAAVADYDQVVRRGNSNYYQKALQKAASLSYHHQADFAAAYQYYQRLVEITNDPAERYQAQLGLMRSAYRTNQAAATRSAASAVAEYSGASGEERSEALFYLGKTAYSARAYDEALQRLNEVVRTSNNVLTAEARYLIAHIYYLRRQLDIAERLCHSANRESSNYPFWVAKSLLLLSDIYVDRNDLFNARAPLEALIENFKGDSSIVEEARRKLDAIEKLQAEQSRIKPTLKDSIELDTTQHEKNQ
ncbi:MAG: tetratricopeptide repeat protein [Saprospiraceae bacterium]|nr:tetratricopeptide repeat protein [Saprospiraceae bacterium]